jgi:hypothetical protein
VNRADVHHDARRVWTRNTPERLADRFAEIVLNVRSRLRVTKFEALALYYSLRQPPPEPPSPPATTTAVTPTPIHQSTTIADVSPWRPWEIRRRGVHNRGA